MKDSNIDTIKEEVYKCSKCGLCQSVCPVYLATKNEMYLSRGRYIVLNNFFNNKKKLSKDFIKNMDICLNCNACKNFCPSNLDSAKIFTEIKYHFNYKYNIIPFSYLYFFSMFKHLLKRKFFSDDKVYKCKVKRKIKLVTRKEADNVVYFQGCINKFVNPSDKNAALNLIEELGYNVVKITSNCCGLPFLSDGNLEKFSKNMRKIKKSIPENVKYIVCSCDSCYQTLKQAFDNDEISSKLITVEALLKAHYIEISAYPNAVRHKPYAKTDSISVFENIPVLNRKGSCSLMENFFIMKYPKLAESLIKEVFYKKEETDNKIIITTCLLSKFGLEQGTEYTNSNAQIYSLSEYICSVTDNLSR